MSKLCEPREDEVSELGFVHERDDSVIAGFIGHNINWEQVQKKKEAAAGFNYGYFRHVVSQLFGASTYIFVTLITIFTPVAWVIISQYLAQVNVSTQSWSFDEVSISRINDTHYHFSSNLRLTGASYFEFSYPTSNVSLLISEEDGQDVLGFIEIPGMQVDRVRPFIKRVETILVVTNGSKMEEELRAVTSGQDVQWHINGELKTVIDFFISLRTFVSLHSPVSVPSICYDKILASDVEITQITNNGMGGSCTVTWDNLSNTALKNVYKTSQMIFVPDVQLSGNSIASESMLLTCDAIDIEAYQSDARGAATSNCTFNVVHTKEGMISNASQVLDPEIKYALAGRLLERFILRGGVNGVLRGPLPVPTTNLYADTNDSRIPAFVPIMGRMTMQMDKVQKAETDADVVAVAGKNNQIVLNPLTGTAEITLSGSTILQKNPGFVVSSTSLRLVDHSGRRGVAFTRTDNAGTTIRCPAPPAYLHVEPTETRSSTNVPVALSIQNPTIGMDVPDGCTTAYLDAICCSLLSQPSMTGQLAIEFQDTIITLNYDPTSQVSIKCETGANYKAGVCRGFSRTCDGFIGEYCDE
eukprot:Clim_evm4s233 gene=Clim_evmTU4s233